MIQDRIIQFIEYKGLTKYKFYKKTNLSNGFLDKKGTIGVDKCEIIYSFFPEINLEWLITGKGEMLKTNITTEAVQENSGIDYKELAEARKETIESLKETLESKNEQIQYLKEENTRLKQELASATRQDGNRAAG
ncbi:hypothetical protein V3Q90_14820 [Flavobacterium oreochromis]|uniref:hypothetical protein n=1 Tax=Flavobacterium oreochromis TaxID=2906078 RepID=UPI00385FBA56